MIDPHRLDEILEVLRDRGVAQFSCSDFSVTLTPAALPESTDTVTTQVAIEKGNEQAKAPAARGVFAHPSLWPSGVAPSFPKESA